MMKTRMRKLGLLTAVFALALFLYSAPAKAKPLVLGSGANSLFYTNVENWIDKDGSGDISTNDILYGIFNVQNISNGGSDIWGMDNVGGDGTLHTLTGYFLTTVTGVNVHGGLGGDVHISLGAATADPNGVLTAADLSSGVVLKMFEDDTSVGGPGTAYTTNDAGGAAGDIANATDGSVWATLNIGPNGYWYTHAPVVPPTNAGEAIGESWFGLDFVINNTGKSFLAIDDPLESEAGAGGIALVEMYGTSNINANNPGITGGDNWDFMSQDPAVVVTPEPGTLLLLGSGLLGGALLRRRRARKS